MTDAQQKKNILETRILLGVLLVVAAGFAWMAVALLRSSDVAVEPVAVGDPHAVPATPDPATARAYDKPLTIHAYNIAREREMIPASRDDHEDLAPQAPREDRWSSQVLNKGRLTPLPRPSTSRAEAEEDEDADRARTGWGWLADDIMSKRKAGESGGDGGGQQDGEEQDVEDPRRLAGREEREQPGSSSLLSMDGGRDSLLRPLYDYALDSDAERRRDGSGERADRSDRPGDPSTPDSEYADDGNGRESGRAAGLDVRDPFAGSAEPERPAFGSSDWRFGDGDASVFRPREEVAARSEDAASSYGSAGLFAGGDEYGRVVGDAASDASRLSSGWSGYASDSMFSGGGGYTPQGVSAGGSDALFSGAGVFGGGIGSSVVTPLDSGSGGIAPLGGSSLGGASASGSSIGGSGFDNGLKTPSALPW